MATVTVYTAARMKEIEDSAIIDGDIVGDDLFLTRYDGAQINAGIVRGEKGIQGNVGPAGPPVVVTSTTRPSNPVDGMMIYETDTDNLLTYDGTSWVLPKNVGEPSGHFQARRTTQYAVPHNVNISIPMTMDEGTIGSGTWSGTALTIGKAGLYSVGWGLAWSFNANGYRLGYIWDGSTVLGASQSDGGAGGFSSMSGQVIRRFTTGTVLSVRAYQTSGASLNVLSNDNRIYFTVTSLF